MKAVNSQDIFETVVSHLKSHSKWTGLLDGINLVQSRNPYEVTDPDAKKMWQEQTGLNFPLLYLASLYLFIYAREKGYETFLFATRDCCHWIRIFKAMFPDTKAHYFQCSRNMFGKGFREPHPSFRKYVTNLVLGSEPEENLTECLEKTIYIDIHGTGQHVFNYFRKNFPITPGCFLLSSSCKNYHKFPSVAKKRLKSERLINLVFGCHGAPIEMLNYDLVGTLQDFSKHGKPIRDKPEYDLKIIKPYHQCINFLTRYVVPMNQDKVLERYSLDELLPLINTIFKLITSNHIVARKHIRHIGRHKKPGKS